MALLKRGKIWYARFQLRGKNYLLSTKSTVKEMAEDWEKKFKVQLVAGEVETMKSIGIVRKDKVATVGEVIERYLKKGNHLSAQVKLLSMKRNAESLRRVVAISRGWHKEDFEGVKFKNRRAQWKAKREETSEHNAKIDAVSLNDLDDQMVEKFKANSRKLEFADSGTNSTLTQAKSIFSPRNERFFKGLKFPNLTSFLKARGNRQTTGSVAFVEIPEEMLKKIEQSAQAARDAGNVDLWRAYLMMRRLGMRNVEVKAAKKEWIAPHKGIVSIHIINRPDFKTKAGIERRISLSSELLAEFKDIPDGQHLIAPGQNKTKRAKIVDRKLNTLVRDHMGETREKASYELRKQAGAEIVSDPNRGMEEAHYFLGHSNISTTIKHYSALTRQLKALEH